MGWLSGYIKHFAVSPVGAKRMYDEGGPMTFTKITKAMEVTSVYWTKLMPVVRDMVLHYQDIHADGLLTGEDKERAADNVRQLTKILAGGKG